jgi:2,3-bisphosphoglycerate-dependent phosphoglycerate mutase
VLPTARALGMQVETRDALREWNAGIGATPDWEPHYRECWRSPTWAVPGGERHAELEQRAVAALMQVAVESPEASVVVIGSHGTWIARALHGLGQPVDEDFWLGMPMPAVFEVDVEGERRRTRS